MCFEPRVVDRHPHAPSAADRRRVTAPRPGVSDEIVRPSRSSSSLTHSQSKRVWMKPLALICRAAEPFDQWADNLRVYVYRETKPNVPSRADKKGQQ